MVYGFVSEPLANKYHILGDKYMSQKNTKPVDLYEEQDRLWKEYNEVVYKNKNDPKSASLLHEAELELAIKVNNNEIRKANGLPPEYKLINPL